MSAEQSGLEKALPRARKLELLRQEQWICDLLEELWNNPDVYEESPSELYNVPEDVNEKDYALFRLGIAFGTEYEHEYPRGEWNAE